MELTWTILPGLIGEVGYSRLLLVIYETAIGRDTIDVSFSSKT